MLPARLDRVLLWPGLAKHCVEVGRQHVFGGARDPEVVLGPLVSSVIRTVPARTRMNRWIPPARAGNPS